MRKLYNWKSQDERCCWEHDYDTGNALCAAASSTKNTRATAQLLIDRGIDVQVIVASSNSSNSGSPLGRALEAGNLAVAELVINKGAMISYNNCIKAVQKGYFDIIKLMYRKSPDLFDNVIKSDWYTNPVILTPIEVAANHKKFDIVIYLINEGSVVRSTVIDTLVERLETQKFEQFFRRHQQYLNITPTGTTPLHIVSAFDPVGANILIRLGASLFSKVRGKFPVDVALENKQYQLARRMLEQMFSERPVYFESEEYHSLKERHANPALDEHHCYFSEDFDIATWDESIFDRDDQGMKPVDWAFSRREYRLVLRILERMFELRPNYVEPKPVAAKKNKPLEEGAPIVVPKDLGRWIPEFQSPITESTPLHIAAAKYPLVALQLIDSPIYTNTWLFKVVNGWYPVDIAIDNWHYALTHRILKEMLKKSPQYFSSSDYLKYKEQRSSKYAEKSESESERGCDISPTIEDISQWDETIFYSDNNGWKPVDHAADRRDYELVLKILNRMYELDPTYEGPEITQPPATMESSAPPPQLAHGRDDGECDIDLSDFPPTTMVTPTAPPARALDRFNSLIGSLPAAPTGDPMSGRDVDADFTPVKEEAQTG